MQTKRRRRDPFIDIIRVLATALVVLQHCLIPVFTYRDGELSTGNALATPGWWVITWVSQVMPLVFLAGGAANSLSYRSHTDSGGTPASWVAKRVRRLVLPVLPLAAVWIILPNILLALGVPAQPVHLVTQVVPQLLWFLGVYLAAVLCTPLAVAAHRRFGLAVLPVLGLAAVSVDMLRFSAAEPIGYLNVLFVWLAVHQVGLCYADGLFDRITKRGAAILAIAGYGTTAALVIFGPYPANMVGMPGAPLSNMDPPTICLLGVMCGQLGLALLAKRALLNWAARPRVTAVLKTLAPRMMTVYLWHMSALAVITGIAVVGFGYQTPAPGSLAWWLAAPVWLAAALTVLIGLVRVFERYERIDPLGDAKPGTAQVISGAVLVGAGLLGFIIGGFGPAALPWTAALVTGLYLTTRSGAPITAPVAARPVARV